MFNRPRSAYVDPGLHHLRVDGQPEWEEFPDRIADGENSLVIEQPTSRTSTPDDIRVGEVFLDHRSVTNLL